MVDVVQQAVDELAAALGHPVLVEDPAHRPLWWSAHEDVDGTRIRTILRRPLAPAVTEMVERMQLSRATVPVRTPAVPDGDMLPRWCVPMRTQDREHLLLGYVWIVDSGLELEGDQLTQVSTCAGLATKVLTERIAADRGREVRRSELLARLVTGRDAAALEQLCELEQVGPETPVIVTAPPGDADWELPDDLGLHVVGITAMQAASGAPLPISDLHVAVHRATVTRQVLAAGARLTRPTWDALGAWRLVAAAPGDLRPGDIHPGADRLAALPRPELLTTAWAVLESGGDVIHAAAELHVHRSTLYYRLDRIAELTGVDLRHDAGRLDLQFALRLAAYRRVAR